MLHASFPRSLVPRTVEIYHFAITRYHILLPFTGVSATCVIHHCAKALFLIMVYGTNIHISGLVGLYAKARFVIIVPLPEVAATASGMSQLAKTLPHPIVPKAFIDRAILVDLHSSTMPLTSLSVDLSTVGAKEVTLGLVNLVIVVRLTRPGPDVELIVYAVEDGIEAVPLWMKHVDKQGGLHRYFPTLHHLRHNKFIRLLASAVQLQQFP